MISILWITDMYSSSHKRSSACGLVEVLNLGLCINWNCVVKTSAYNQRYIGPFLSIWCNRRLKM